MDKLLVGKQPLQPAKTLKAKKTKTLNLVGYAESPYLETMKVQQPKVIATGRVQRARATHTSRSPSWEPRLSDRP